MVIYMLYLRFLSYILAMWLANHISKQYEAHLFGQENVKTSILGSAERISRREQWGQEYRTRIMMIGRLLHSQTTLGKRKLQAFLTLEGKSLSLKRKVKEKQKKKLLHIFLFIFSHLTHFLVRDCHGGRCTYILVCI